MSRGEHRVRCNACGQWFNCGDCIPLNCFSCQRAIKEHHPGERCPCVACDRIYAPAGVARALERRKTVNGPEAADGA